MSFQDTNPKNPLNGGLDGLKQQGLSAAENKITGIISEKLDNPIVNKIAENKDTIKNVVNRFSSVENPIDDASIGRLNHPDDIKKYLSKKTFKDFLTEKASPLVYCTLTIDGKEFLAKNSYVVELRQHTNDHDTFTIITPDDSLDSFEGYVMENSKNLLGKKVTINFHRYGEVRQSFMGIIANIGQLTNDSCVPTSLEMILKDLGKEQPNFYIKGALDFDGGAYVRDIPSALEKLGVENKAEYSKTRTITEIQKELDNGNSAIASVNDGQGGHAVVIDRIENGNVVIRDPLPVGQGSSYSVPIEFFENANNGTVIIHK